MPSVMYATTFLITSRFFLLSLSMLTVFNNCAGQPVGATCVASAIATPRAWRGVATSHKRRWHPRPAGRIHECHPTCRDAINSVRVRTVRDRPPATSKIPLTVRSSFTSPFFSLGAPPAPAAARGAAMRPSRGAGDEFVNQAKFRIRVPLAVALGNVLATELALMNQLASVLANGSCAAIFALSAYVSHINRPIVASIAACCA